MQRGQSHRLDNTRWNFSAATRRYLLLGLSRPSAAAWRCPSHDLACPVTQGDTAATPPSSVAKITISHHPGRTYDVGSTPWPWSDDRSIAPLEILHYVIGLPAGRAGLSYAVEGMHKSQVAYWPAAGALRRHDPAQLGKTTS